MVVATYEEFQRKGLEKLGLAATEPLRVVLEGDGTQVRKKACDAEISFDQRHVIGSHILLLYFNGLIPPPFCLFPSFSHYNFNKTN